MHEVDFYRAGRTVLSAFEVPERRYAAGTAYLRGQGRGRVRAVHGVDELQREIGHLIVEANFLKSGSRIVGVMRVRGT